MEYTNAFIGQTIQPTTAEVEAALGSSSRLWKELIHWMADREGVTDQEWKGVCINKYGWSLRLKQKKRNILYLSPGKDCFMASFILSDKALDEAKHAQLPKAVQDALAGAPRYPEGNGLRLLVNRAAQLPAIRKIAHIKVQC